MLIRNSKGECLTCSPCKSGYEGRLAHTGAALQEHAALQLQRAHHAQRIPGCRGRSEFKCCAQLCCLMRPTLYKKWRDAPHALRGGRRVRHSACNRSTLSQAVPKHPSPQDALRVEEGSMRWGFALQN